jgi:Protein of unknown function (DUF2934)
MKSAAETLEDRIRERAYQLWEADGRPPGRDVEFWHRACEMVATDDVDQPKSRAQRRKPEQTKSSQPPGKRMRQTFRPASPAASISPG